jgi:hypothetical protein
MSKKPKAKAPAKAPPAKAGGDLNFGTRNYAALGMALACILFGFYLLSQGSITAAPILLVLGYCVLIPYGLATGSKATPGE